MDDRVLDWPDFVKESVPDRWQSIRKWPLTMQVCACRGKTENGSIRRWAGRLACRFSEVQSYSQEQLSWGNCNREKRVWTVFKNQWAKNEEKQDGKNCGQFYKFSGQGEQSCSEPSVLCLIGSTEDSQKRKSYNDQDVKEQRQRQESLWHLGTEDDGWN